MEGRYIIGIWMPVMVLMLLGWHIPGASVVAWPGAITLAFGAAVALSEAVVARSGNRTARAV